MTTSAELLDKLYEELAAKRSADVQKSYTAQLLAAGSGKIAQKVGEEAVETVIAALQEDEQALAQESADLIYHLLVLWLASGVTPDQVWEILAARQGQSGLAEKAARKKDKPE